MDFAHRNVNIDFREATPIKPKIKKKTKFPWTPVLLGVALILIIVLILNINILPLNSSNKTSNGDNQNNPTPTVSTPTPSPTPTKLPKAKLDKLKQDILATLGTDSNNFGIYIKNFTTGDEIGINQEVVLPPASIYKVNVAMLILKDIDGGKYTLDTQFALKSKNKMYTTDQMYYLPTGSKYTLRQYLNYMIVTSDNTAMTSLEEIIGPVKTINTRIKDELGVTTFYRDPHEATAKDVGHVFELIYKGTFLSEGNNTVLLDLLKHTASWLQDRIPAGIPVTPDNEVAHKIGYIVTDAGVAFEDAGIVYTKDIDFVIVFLNEDVNEAKAKQNIVKITSDVYEAFTGN